MNKQVITKLKYQRRKGRTRSKIVGTKDRPRLNVYRSNHHIYVQLVDDQKETTLIAANDREIKKPDANKTDAALEVGRLIAKKAIEQNISQVVFDRGGRIFHGRVAAVAKGAREGGLKF